jgi:hypothetical protein
MGRNREISYLQWPTYFRRPNGENPLKVGNNFQRRMTFDGFSLQFLAAVNGLLKIGNDF